MGGVLGNGIGAIGQEDCEDERRFNRGMRISKLQVGKAMLLVRASGFDRGALPVDPIFSCIAIRQSERCVRRSGGRTARSSSTADP